MKLYQRFKHPRFSAIILLICLSVILLTGGALAAEHHVSTLDDLTDKIASADYGDTIKVLAGTYSLTDTLNITTRVTLSGGWDSTFTTQTPGTSILDGQGSYQILNISASADVDGFTFQNGNDTNGDGGGISIGTSSNFAVNISNCTFTGNTAKSGGAMGIDAPTTITNCTFTGNKAVSNYGGAISSGHYGKLTITDCTFTENSSQNSGGGIYMNGEPESKISNCVITKNTSGNYGGGFATGAFFGGSSANVTFESCDITNNMSTGSGAGLYLGGGTSTFISCDISGNVISGDNSGAGVYSIHASPKFINCNVSNNKTNYSSGGGGFYFTNVPDDNGVEITNCTISGNSAPIGGGLAFEDGPATITNCTFTGNSGGAYSNHVLFKGTMDFINCTIVNNTTADENEFYLPYANLSLTNTLIWNDSADKIFNTNNHSAISLDHCALPEDFAKQGDGAITNDSPVYVSTNWTPVSAEIEVDGVNHIVYEVGSSSGVNHELDFLIGAALSDDNTPKYDQIGRERKNLTIGAVEGNKVIFEINIDSGITHGAVSPDRSLASKDVLVTLTVSPDTGYYVSSVTYSGDTVSAEVISADGVYSFNMPSEDITVSAVFSAIIYPLSYDLKGGSVEGGNPLTYTIESPDFTLTNPTRTGYTFTGWTGTGIEGSADIVTVLTGSYGDRSYAATWTPINYSITYTLNGGSVSGNPAVYTIESGSFTLNNPTRTGYDFAGWTGTGLTEATQTVTVNKGAYGVRSYTATWTPITYSIKYHLNGGTSSGNPTAYTIESGDLKLTNPTKKGYDFEGWTLSGDESGEISSDVTIPTGTTGELEYIANWKLTIYTISYDLKAGTVSPDNPAAYTIESDTFTLNNPLKDCYTFEGWTGTSLDALSKSVTITESSTGDREYTANYTPITYALSYDLQGGTVSPDNPASYDIESDNIKLNNPVKNGYDFAGWSFDNTISLDVTIPKGSSGDKNFTAIWTPTIYTISYDLDGGTSADNPTSYTIETPSFTLTNPTKTGYTFAGWKGTDIDGTAEIVTVLQGSTGSRSYTAVWTPITYTIRYKLNNASDPGNPAGYTIESGAITLTNPSRNGYTFDGWTGTDLTAKTQSVTIPAGSTGNREYTANFTPITYTITYELNGGTADNPTSYTVETEAFTLNNPVKAEYSFTGWTGTGVDSIMQTLTIPRGSTGNRTYTAEYEVASAPVLAESSLTLNAFKGQPASITVTATEGAEIEWSIAGNLPSGLSFSSSGKSAAISGTLQLGTSGTYSVTVTATNPKGSAEASVTINVTNDFAQSGDVTEGARTTAETADGMTRTNKATSFTNGAGSLILSADIAITAEAEEFIAIAGEFFETGLSVDVTLLISDTDYDTFTYSLDVAGLPEWLTVSGDLTATGAANAGNNTYHYGFWLSGIPTEATDVEEITFTANAKVSGDSPVLEASVSKDISVQAFVVVNEINVAVLNPEPLNLTAGTAGSRVVSASVRALYSDGTSEMLQAGDYGITWTTASRDLASLGMTFANGVLNVSTSTPAGTYRIPVTATATFGGVGGTASSVIVVTVSDVAPILSPDVTSITARRGSEVTPITITATQGTNITWSTSGILVDGLSYNASGNSVVISGTVSETAATGQYVYTVTASNTAGEASVSITITVNSAAPLTPETAETTTQEISTMTDTEIAEKFAGKTDIVITGNTTNEEFAQALEKISAVTTVTTLDLSSASGITEVKLNENSTVENVVLTGNDSVKTVEITGNSNLKSLELTGSSVTRVEANNCANLEEVNIEGCDTIEYLDVSGSSITSLNARDCSNLQTLSFGSCSVSSLNLSGCKSLENLTCDKNSLMKLDASELRNLKRIYCADQSTRAKVTKFKGRYVFAFATMRALSVTAADDSDSFTSEDLARVQDVKAYDAAGNELTAEYDAETGEITFPENAERVVYNYATGFEDTLMDVSIYPEAEDSGEDSGNVRGVGSSSGGCESGFGIFALIVAAGFMTLSKKR